MNRLRYKVNKNFLVQLLLFLVAISFLLGSYRRSQESTMAIILPLELEGEYSLGGGEWTTYRPGEKISARKGDLIFRGNFTLDLSSESEYQFYLNHVELTIFRDGEKVYSSKPDYPLSQETICTKAWETWFCEPIQEGEVLEFHLHNPHKTGNVTAYQEFLESIYSCPQMLLQGKIQMDNRTIEVSALLLLTIALVLLGMAGGSAVIDHELGQKLWPMGFLVLFMGGYILFDKQMDIINYYRDILFTNLQNLCMMFAAYELSFIVQGEINERREKKIPPIVLGLSIFNIALLLISSFGKVMLYDMMWVWQIAQGIVFAVLLFFAIKTLVENRERKWSLLISGMVLSVFILFEFFNSYFYLMPQGILWKIVFICCLIHHLIEAVRTVPKNYRASKETERLKRELKNSRVVLAMSQIRTHFIFNVLNAISGMCLYDPAQANQTVVHFAKYLRGNINVLQEDELIFFGKELEHLEDYIVLEKVRFEDKIQYVKELEVQEFLIPPLVLQPIVENAIKHGLLRTKTGGTIRLKTRRESGDVLVEISDDGAGFDTQKPMREGAVGIGNVKFRLEYMIQGKLEIQSAPEKGTTVIIRMPYRDAVGER